MKQLLITDVDNTLFDWVNIWYYSFGSMLHEVSLILEIPEESLYESISKIHQKYATSEYAFLLEELPEVRGKFGLDALIHMQPAIDAFRQARREHLKLYPGVLQTLQNLKGRGVTIVAYTESLEFYTSYRFRKLGLDHLIDVLYSPKDHDVPQKGSSSFRRYPEESYKMEATVVRHTPKGELKPNPHILQTIIQEMGFTKDDCLYVGDSKVKDILMAQSAGVMDVWARYGQAQHRQQYELLKSVTHWTKEMVEKEDKVNKDVNVVPTHELVSDFSEILSLFQ